MNEAWLAGAAAESRERLGRRHGCARQPEDKPFTRLLSCWTEELHC